jgi:hypothetical protein
MKQVMSAYSDLLQELIDSDKQKQLCHDSPDWEIIGDALIEYYELVHDNTITPRKKVNLLRCLAEAIYLKGYQRHEKESSLVFVVAEPEAEATQ